MRTKLFLVALLMFIMVTFGQEKEIESPLSIRIDELEKRVEELEEILNGKILLDEREGKLEWVPVIIRK